MHLFDLSFLKKLGIARIPRKNLLTFKTMTENQIVVFLILPGILETDLRFFSSPSAIVVLENEQLKTVEMNKSVNHIVLSI